MATLNATEAWQSTTAGADESWQCITGPVRIHRGASAPTNPSAGHFLERGDSFTFKTTGTVWYRAEGQTAGMIDTQAI